LFEITFIGAVLSVVGFYSFIIKTKWLPLLSIFFVPFTATAIINIFHNGKWHGVQAAMFFGFLWLANDLLFKSKYFKVAEIIKSRKEFSVLSLYVLVVSLSLLMPVFINGDLHVNIGLLAISGG
jgi:hypothetical protein